MKKLTKNNALKITASLVLLSMLTACDGGGVESSDAPAHEFTYNIDPVLTPDQLLLPGLDGGSPRQVGVLTAPGGGKVEYVADEVVFKPANQVDLDDFLKRYGGTVLRDGTVPTSEESMPIEAGTSSGWYLIRIDPAMSATDDLALNLRVRGVTGHHTFSSRESAATAGILAREVGRDLRPNFIFQFMAVNEHLDDNYNPINAEEWPWMTEDDEPNTAGDQGLSVGVTHAWDYLRYLEVPPANGTFEPPVIAIIDGGFALDTTGLPTNGNLDYFPTRPLQYDLVDYDGSADGLNIATCGGTPCPWHGTGSFGVALARHSNGYGGAGTSGNVAWPMLIRVDASYYSVSQAIRTAAIHGADVISLSLGGSGCSVDVWVCEISPDDVYTTMQNAIDLATSYGAVVLAAAGNEGNDLATTYMIPCELERVICVGSVDGATMNVFNYGGGVDIWAPTNVYSTVSPQTAMLDNNDVGVDELYTFGGTSASTPFVAGIVALMKALDPGIRWQRVQNILQQTANVSSDPLVTRGYVDAYRAVQAVRENIAPSVAITSPGASDIISYRPFSFRADASDAENNDAYSGVITWSSDRDGELCTVNGFYFAALANYCNPELSLGTHVITVIATDIHGATMQDTVTVEVVNHSPTIQVTQFAPGSSFFSNQIISLGAYANDEDEGPPFDQTSLEWFSDLDGFLGLGTGLQTSLSVGTHTLTAVATDELGLTAEDTTSVIIVSGDGVPTIQILEPNIAIVGPGTFVTFRATAIDAEDGVLTGTNLQWSSNIDGILGTGTEFQSILSGSSNVCNRVRHTITLRVNDSDGHVVTETFQIKVGIIC